MNCKKCNGNIPDNSNFCMHCGFNQSKDTATSKPKQRGNGQGSVYKLPNGKWRAEIVLGYQLGEDNKKHKVTKTKSDFLRKKDALEYIPTLRNEKKTLKISLEYLYNEFIKTKKYDKLSASQKITLKTAWNRCANIKFKNISDLTLQDMQNNIDVQVKTYYPARDIKTILSHIYTFAIKHNYVDRNPTEYIELPENSAAKKDSFKDDEIQALWKDYETNSFTGYIIIMIYAGLRYGELSIPKENIFIQDKYMIGGIKTDAGIDRTIPIADKILPIVTDIYNSNQNNLIEMGQERFYKQYWEAIERTGVRKLNPHCCRHTYFTKLAEAEIPTSIITTAGGHKNYQTTMGYTHIQLAKLLDAVNKI